MVPYYTPEVMAKVIKQPLETEQAQQWVKKHLAQSIAKPQPAVVA
jgi:hypothetical protein